MAQTSATAEPAGLAKIRLAAIETLSNKGFQPKWKSGNTPPQQIGKTDYTVFPKIKTHLTRCKTISFTTLTPLRLCLSTVYSSFSQKLHMRGWMYAYSRQH